MPGEVVGNILHFKEVTRHQTGHYICEADNGFGPDPVSKEIKLVVNRKYNEYLNTRILL